MDIKQSIKNIMYMWKEICCVGCEYSSDLITCTWIFISIASIVYLLKYYSDDYKHQNSLENLFYWIYNLWKRKKETKLNAKIKLQHKDLLSNQYFSFSYVLLRASYFRPNIPFALDEITSNRNSQLKDCLFSRFVRYSTINSFFSPRIYNNFKMKNLCCSQFFQKNSPINQPESLIYEYKMYSFPFSKSNKDNILKTIVGFLNNQGGFLFIGIKETPNKERFAVGLTLTGRQKESLHQSIRSMV